MRILLPALVAVTLFASGCASSTKPHAYSVSGTVRFLNGQVAAGAWVRSDEGTLTQADTQGRYALIVRSAGPVTLTAGQRRDPDLAYAGTWTGTVRVTPEASLAGHLRLHETSADIVLDRFDPI